MEKQRTGAATLLMSMLAKAATNMLATRTVLGTVPALLRMKVAKRLSSLHLESAAARVKPPRRSMITGLHIAEKTNLAASGEARRPCGLLLLRTTLRTTARNGIMSEVTNRGIAC